MSSKLLVSISLLSLAAVIFVYSSDATCDCNASAFHLTHFLIREVHSMTWADTGTSGSYSGWAEVGNNLSSYSDSFSNGGGDATVVAGSVFDFYEGMATIWTSCGCDDTSHI
jgi:hypothetical protein